MGMGLSIVRTIVEAHKGEIRAENNYQGGAVFRVSLLLAREGARSIQGTGAHDASRSGTDQHPTQ